MNAIHSKQHKGFTLVELLIVIVIIAILAAISIVSYNGLQNRAATSVLKAELKNFATEMGVKYAEDEEYPGEDYQVEEYDKGDDTKILYTRYDDGAYYCATGINSKRNITLMISSDDTTPREGEMCDGHDGVLEENSRAVRGCFETKDTTGGLRIISYRGGTLSEYATQMESRYPGYVGEALDPSCPLDVVIPSQLDGKNVVAIGGGDGSYGLRSVGPFGDRGITSIVIPNTVKTIGSYAFNAVGLSSITIPDSVEVVESSAFLYSGLTSVTIPNSVTSIGDSAFAENSLTSVTIPDSVTSVGQRAFFWNQLGAVSLPSHLSSLQNDTGAYSSAFYNNPSLSFTIRP